ncbi:MAG: diguanylate cyclase [Peptostreptococcaceae bacterium]|nr:diguanylate cyclase [Peptostreptococcaceae bacterium]
MDKEKYEGWRKDAFLLGILACLFISSFFNYLLFHSLVGIYSISIAFAVFMIAWNAREYNKGSYIIFLGIAYLFIGFIDLMHMLSFKEMNIFVGHEFYAGQFRIAARWMESLTYFVAFSFNDKIKLRISYETIFAIYFLATVSIVSSVLYFKTFPKCCIEGIANTPFKTWSEVIIVLLLMLAWLLLDRSRSRVGEKAYPFLVWAIVFTILSEMFIFIFSDSQELFNLIGQFLKLASYYMIYKVAIDLGIKKPYDSYLREHQQNETLLKDAALVDIETGLLNSRAYERLKGKMWVLLRKTRTNVRMGLISINDFDKLKMEYGKSMSRKVLNELIEVTGSVISDDYFFFRIEENTFLLLSGEEEEKMLHYSETIRKQMSINIMRKYGIEANINCGISEKDSMISYSMDSLYDSANESLLRKKMRYMIRNME